MLDVDVTDRATTGAPPGAARTEAHGPRRARPAWAAQVRHGGPRARRLRPGVAAAVVAVVLVYAALAATLAGGATAWVADPPDAVVPAAGGAGALVGAIGAVDWIRRRWRHASFDVVRRPGPLWVWEGDPSGAAVVWWLPGIVLGPPLVTVGIVARAVSTAVRRGERRVAATVLAVAAIGVGVAGGLGAVAASRSGETVRGAVLGVVVVAGAIGARPAWQRARRFVVRTWPPTPMVPGGGAEAVRRRGGVVPLPPGVRHRAADPHPLAAGVVALAVVAALSGWALADPDADGGGTAAAPSTTVPLSSTTAPLATTTTPDVPVVAAIEPLEGFGLWCHVLQASASTDIVLDPAAFVLRGPDGRTLEPIDVGDLDTREPTEAVDVEAGTSGRVEVCFAVADDAPAGTWQLVGTVAGSAVVRSVTR